MTYYHLCFKIILLPKLQCETMTNRIKFLQCNKDFMNLRILVQTYTYNSKNQSKELKDAKAVCRAVENYKG